MPKTAHLIAATISAATLALMGFSSVAANASTSASTAQHAAATRSETAASMSHPLSPAGFHGMPASAAGAKVIMHTITLPKKSCASLSAVHPGTVPGCKIDVYTSSVNRQPLPRGTKMQSAVSSSSDYWYWSDEAWACPAAGCWVWKIDLQMDGVANDLNVWQWNEYCTPSGYGETITWCGYLHNGGGSPYYGMQFGVNWNSCVGPYGIGCFSHWMRVWINDDGNQTSSSSG